MISPRLPNPLDEARAKTNRQFTPGGSDDKNQRYAVSGIASSSNITGMLARIG